LVIVVVLVAGALFFLSSLPKQQPTQMVEVPVTEAAPGGGNAH
jgi:hypothetical protein